MTVSKLLPSILRLHAVIRERVVAACEQISLDDISRIDHESESDTIYAIDRVSEQVIVDWFTREVASQTPVVLVAEGLAGGEMVLPAGTPPEKAVWRIIIDPIDGTRGLMYQKRSAWVLTGVAPNRGQETGLQDIELAVQTEIPLVKQHLSDVLWAERGQGVQGVRFNRLTGEKRPFFPTPSRATTIAHGFAMIARFFPGARDELAAIDEEIITAVLGPVAPGKAHCFEDQYICTGGQLYELMAGHDRFIADLRPLLDQLLARRGLSLGICCHPYDLCTELIARELGVIITDPAGNPLNPPLDTQTNIAWAGYANTAIRAQVEPHLQAALRRRNLL
ncbi:MAG: inositol monophosphatase [Chloroflexi bacterium]|nr:MAG: inositol monophosphatase [Chloroflexota bacterium]